MIKILQVELKHFSNLDCGRSLRYVGVVQPALPWLRNSIASLASWWGGDVLFAAAKCRQSAGSWHSSGKCLFNIQAYEVWVEMDQSKIKFQWACLLCLAMYVQIAEENGKPSLFKDLSCPPATSFPSFHYIQLQCSEEN